MNDRIHSRARSSQALKDVVALLFILLLAVSVRIGGAESASESGPVGSTFAAETAGPQPLMEPITPAAGPPASDCGGEPLSLPASRPALIREHGPKQVCRILVTDESAASLKILSLPTTPESTEEGCRRGSARDRLS